MTRLVATWQRFAQQSIVATSMARYRCQRDEIRYSVCSANDLGYSIIKFLNGEFPPARELTGQSSTGRRQSRMRNTFGRGERLFLTLTSLYLGHNLRVYVYVRLRVVEALVAVSPRSHGRFAGQTAATSERRRARR